MSITVRAAIARHINQPFTIEQVDLRAPVGDEILVQMKASGLCHTDLSVVEGKFPLPLPAILGHEGAGIVLECGSEVKTVKPGDHVILGNLPECGHCPRCLSEKTNYCAEIDKGRTQPSVFSIGGEPLRSMSKAAAFATHTVLSEIYASPIPKHIPFESACLVGCGVLTGVGAALNRAKIDKDSTVVVFGMGSIGLNAVQGAQIAGARRIVAVDLNPAKEVTARLFGATDFINASALDKPLDAHILALIGAPVDYSFECVGNTELLKQAAAIVNPFWGVCVAVGIPPHTGEIKLPATSFYFGRSLLGTFLGQGKPRRDIPRIIDWYQQGKLRLDELVTHRITLDEINEGFAMMKRSEVIRSVIVY